MTAFLRLFGGLRLESAEAELSGRAIQKKRLALLALLGSSPTRRLSRDKLTAYLWPESDTERARHQLASSIYELRKALGEDALTSVADEVALNPERITSDVVEFDAALRRSDREAAIRIYTAPFLDGFFLPEAEEFERWVESERARLAHAFAKALEDLAMVKEKSGDPLGALELWRRLAAQDLYNSRVACRLMHALTATGDRAGALQHARAHALLLREELGVEPDPELRALVESLRAEREPAMAPPSPSPRIERLTSTPRPAPDVHDTVAPSLSLPPRRRVRAALLGLAALAAVILLLLSRGRWEPLLHAARRQPIVVMMDSPHPARVYDDEAIAASGTNADILNDILRDLPIQRVKETAGPLWHRDEEIRTLNPDLILIHLSAFCTEECEPHRVRLRRFIEYMADTRTSFLIYSRMPADTLALRYNEMMGDLPRSHPELPRRIHTFSVIEFGTPHWKDPATAAALKLRVKELLSISNEKG